MSRFHERLKRRTLLKQGTALGTLLVLRRPKVVADSRTEVQAAPPREQAVGIRYLERFESPRGTAPGAQVTIELEIAVERLAEFLQQPARTAAVGGTARIGPTVGARFEQGALQAFATCERDPSTRQWLLQGTLLATDGRRIELRAERSLSSRSHRDAAADLARLQYRVTHEAEVLAQGEAVETPAATLLRIASLEVTGTTEPGEIARAKNDFLEFINGECEASYPELPKPFAALDRLSPAEWRALALSVLVMLPQPLPADGPSKADVVSNLERFVMHADTETFAQLRASLRTLGGLSPFLSGHVPSIQRFVEKQLLQKRDTSLKGLLDSLHKVAVLGYYSHPKADKLVGYRRPQPQPRARLQLPTRERPSARVFDVAIVGAGVAGSVLAERLTARHESVVLLEAGPYVPEMTIDSDELLWLARLQKGSGLQLANEGTPYAASVRTFPVLQGNCVGGGGMINNAVCFQMADRDLARWHAHGFPIERDVLRAAYAEIARELPIVPASEATRRLNPALYYLSDTLGTPARPAVGGLPEPGLWECLVNIASGSCLACGLCNTGCGSERKRNALQVHLPAALARDRACELIPDARVEGIALRRRLPGLAPRIAGLHVRGKSGPFTVQARRYVLSAGAVHTSTLLQRSSELLAQAGPLPIGERFCANVASPVLGLYESIIHERPTLQLTHYYYPAEGAGFLIENLYNPPGQSALIVPGYGALHAQRMRQYARTALVGAVVPSLPNGRVRVERDAPRSTRIELPLGDDELRRMRAALVKIASAMLRGGSGRRPTEVIAGVNGGGFAMRTEQDVQRFGRWFTRFHQVALSTGHPQGGSAMSDDPGISVVDREFRLRGFANLHICDASLFPSGAGVNPQWTVMALAHCCANVMTA